MVFNQTYNSRDSKNHGVVSFDNEPVSLETLSDWEENTNNTALTCLFIDFYLQMVSLL